MTVPPDATILLLESEPIMRAALHDALESAGYLVITAGELGEAIDRLAETPADLLITNPYVSNMPGRVAADYLRTKQHGLPVLLVAGFLEDERIEIQNSVEAFYTFPKPFHRDELIAKVQEVLQLVRRRA